MLTMRIEKIRQIWRKNGPELLALCNGRLRRLLEGSIPVFVFHSVEPQRFEQQLRFLADNGYSTITGDAFLEIQQGKVPKPHKSIVLTFDDATGSFWATAYPLLKKYGFQAILFAIPGLVPEDLQNYPNLEDVWEGRANITDILQRESVQPLCTWSELQTMHGSGAVDIQSHSLTHSRIFITPEVVDFLHPDFETYFHGNVTIPVAQTDSLMRPIRPLQLGQPVYRSASRMSGIPRYLENVEVSKQLIAYVNEQGGEKFFEQVGWRKELWGKYQQLKKRFPNEESFESSEETKASIHFEMSRAKTLLEEKLPGKVVQHFCYPWYQGTLLSDAIASETGYQIMYYGLDRHASAEKNVQTGPFTVPRIAEEFLGCLPGEGGGSVTSIFIGKAMKLGQKSQKGNQVHSSQELTM